MRASFWRGIATAILALSIFQDMLGMERYIDLCQRSWVHMSFWWWVPPFAALIIWQMHQEYKLKLSILEMFELINELKGVKS